MPSPYTGSGAARTGGVTSLVRWSMQESRALSSPKLPALVAIGLACRRPPSSRPKVFLRRSHLPARGPSRPALHRPPAATSPPVRTSPPQPDGSPQVPRRSEPAARRRSALPGTWGQPQGGQHHRSPRGEVRGDLSNGAIDPIAGSSIRLCPGRTIGTPDSRSTWICRAVASCWLPATIRIGPERRTAFRCGCAFRVSGSERASWRANPAEPQKRRNRPPSRAQASLIRSSSVSASATRIPFESLQETPEGIGLSPKRGQIEEANRRSHGLSRTEQPGRR